MDDQSLHDRHHNNAPRLAVDATTRNGHFLAHGLYAAAQGVGATIVATVLMGAVRYIADAATITHVPLDDWMVNIDGSHAWKQIKETCVPLVKMLPCVTALHYAYAYRKNADQILAEKAEADAALGETPLYDPENYNKTMGRVHRKTLGVGLVAGLVGGIITFGNMQAAEAVERYKEDIKAPATTVSYQAPLRKTSHNAYVMGS